MYTRSSTYNDNAIFFFETQEKNASGSKKAKDYSTGGMLMPGRSYNPTDYRFGMNGQEKINEIASDHYTALFWEYDPRTVRRWNPDPKPDAWESVYAAFANNPIRYSDVLGDTEDERKKAVAKAKEYDKESGGKSDYLLGGKGEPGKPVDCSGLVSGCVKAAGLPNPNKGSASSGVKNIVNNSTKVDFNDIQEGYAVTFNDNKHIGLISGNIERDEEGNVISFSVIGSQTSTGPKQFNVRTDKSSNRNEEAGDGTNDAYWSPKLGSAYKWDTPDKPVLSNGDSKTVQVGTDRYQSVISAAPPTKFSNYLRESNAPIVRDMGAILNYFGF